MELNLSSLFVYLSSLVVSLFFVSLAERYKGQLYGNRMISFQGSTIGIQKCFFAYAFAFIPFWIIAAFRDKSVGVDAHGTYLRIFRYVLYGENAKHFNVLNSEGGYFWLNKLCVLLSDSYQIVLVVSATIIWFCYYVYIIKNSSNCFLSILVLFFSFTYFHTFNGIRQYLAIAIFLCGVKNIYKRNFWGYLFFLLVAMTFHKSVIILLPLYFIYGIKIKPTWVFASILGSILFMRFGRGILAFVLKNSKYGVTFISKAAYSTGFAWSDFICNSVLLICGLIVVTKSKEHDKGFEFNVLLQLIAVIIAVNSNMLPIPYRLLWYANFNTMIYIPQLFEKITLRVNRLIIEIGMMLMYIGYFFYYWIAEVDGIQKFSFWIS
nr:EpsG family protein [uncultured Butyrivibrio sp.]